MINADVVTGRRVLKTEDSDTIIDDDDAAAAGGEEAASNSSGGGVVLPNVSRRLVEERERRAIKLMEESFSHVNQQVRLLMRLCLLLIIVGVVMCADSGSILYTS